MRELDKIDDIKYSIPKGGLSIIIDIACNSNNFCKWLIYDFRVNNKTLLLTPADRFFLTNKGVNKIRLAITLPEDKLIEAIKILRIALCKYKGGAKND